MKIRTCYFKVTNMTECVQFWSTLLDMPPVKNGATYSEFRVDNINLGLVLNNFGDKFHGSNCVPVFEFEDSELDLYIQKAKGLGCTLILDGLADPNLRSVIFSDLWGNEFEFSRFHD